MTPDKDLIKTAWHGLCPRCRQGALYEPGLTLSLRKKCENCGLDLEKNDSADGPAVFLIFIYGFALVPLALLLEFTLHPALWVHVIVWGIVLLVLTIGVLRPTKAYIIALQYKHRPGDWE